MRTLSYTISPNLQSQLKNLEIARSTILLHPLPKSQEIELRFNANIQRIYFSLHLSANMASHKEIIRVLMVPGKKAIDAKEKEIINYKRGLEYITQNWLVNPKPIMPADIYKLYKTVTENKLNIAENQILEILVFLQTSREHNLIQAFISYIQFSLLLDNDPASGRVSRLLPYIFLYKPGLDFRGLLVIEEYFYNNERLIRELKEAAIRKESVTVWVEHFVATIAAQLDQIADNLTKKDKVEESSKTFKLTERQKDILTMFDQPGIRITNRKVQQLFKISQITASRDLAKMAAFGVLFQYGKGRSVYYMRA